MTFPDRNEQWPRLLYHRHFMLTEFLHNMYEPASLPTDVPRDSPLFRQWRSGRDRFETVFDAYRNHLLHEYSIEGIQLDRIEHRMPGIPEFVEEGIGLQHERLYIPLSDSSPVLEELAP